MFSPCSAKRRAFDKDLPVTKLFRCNKQVVGVTVTLKLFLNVTKSVEKSTIGANGSTLVDLKWQIRYVPNIEQLKWNKGKKNGIGG